jgi:hypothetical protein
MLLLETILYLHDWVEPATRSHPLLAALRLHGD